MLQNDPVITIVVEQTKRFAKLNINDCSTVVHKVNQDLRSNHNAKTIETNKRLTNKRLAKTIATVDTPYVMFVKEGHDWSNNLLPAMISEVQSRRPALIEPFAFTGKIPVSPKWTTQQSNYNYIKDTSFYGKMYETRKLLQLYKKLPSLDKRTLHLSYRLHWKLGSTDTVNASYTTSNPMINSNGLKVKSPDRSPLPLIETDSDELRQSILRFVILALRRLQHNSHGTLSMQAMRALVKQYDLKSLIKHSSQHHPIESMWVAWLQQPLDTEYLTKALTAYDIYTRFSTKDIRLRQPSAKINTIEATDCTVRIYREYRPREYRNRSPHPAIYDFYSRPILTDSTILIFDRPSAADDNAEHLYRYIAKNMPEYTKVFFALSEESPDWTRLQAEGFNLVRFYSPKFYDIYLRSDLVVSSQLLNLNRCGKDFTNSRFVYLQHGVQLNDMTTWITSSHFDLIVATGKQEYEYLSSIAPVEVINSGMPRLQYLEKRTTTPRTITYMPTWSFKIHALPESDFARTTFVKQINRLLQNTQLNNYLSKTHTTLKIKLHPNLTDRVSAFHTPENAIITTESYKHLIETSTLVFTDYSSAVFDAAFIDVPVAFYQPDAKSFYKNQIYDQRMDYGSTGVGPVFYEAENLISYITNEEYNYDRRKYSNAKNEFFDPIDKETICGSIMERVLKL